MKIGVCFIVGHDVSILVFWWTLPLYINALWETSDSRQLIFTCNNSQLNPTFNVKTVHPSYGLLQVSEAQLAS